jgi:hypothetical protein
VRWRAQQAAAPPLAPAEKWVTLQHEEAALEFITSLTLGVHRDLLRKRRGLPPLLADVTTAAAFGRSAAKLRGSADEEAWDAAAAAAGEGIAACGQGFDASRARRLAASVPRQPREKWVPSYVLPRPAASAVPLQGWQQQQHHHHEPLDGWRLSEDDGGGGAARNTQNEVREAAARASDAASSCAGSSASSWQ